MRALSDAALARRDVREGGSWTVAQRAKNDALYAAARAGIAIALRLDPATLRRLGRGLGLLAHAILPGPRRLALANVARAMPELSREERAALVRSTYARLGEELGDAVASLDLARPLAPLPFARGARATLDAALAEGRGVLLASAHLGPWERVAVTLVASGVPLTAVVREAYDPRLTALYDRLRGGRGVPTISRARPGAAASLLRVLRRREVLGIPMDLASRVPSVDVPFLGTDAPTPVGPAKLALRTGAAVVVGTAAREDGRVVLAVARVATEDADAKALTARINAVLGDHIRTMPDAWPWMHPRWPT